MYLYLSIYFSTTHLHFPVVLNAIELCECAETRKLLPLVGE